MLSRLARLLCRRWGYQDYGTRGILLLTNEEFQLNTALRKERERPRSVSRDVSQAELYLNEQTAQVNYRHYTLLLLLLLLLPTAGRQIPFAQLVFHPIFLFDMKLLSFYSDIGALRKRSVRLACASQEESSGYPLRTKSDEYDERH